MTELKGLEGYIAALKDPENWEVDDYMNPGQWKDHDAWERWSSASCSNPNTRWRKKLLRHEVAVLIQMIRDSNGVLLSLPREFNEKRVRITVEEIEP